jgi:hypothetical protein
MGRVAVSDLDAGRLPTRSELLDALDAGGYTLESFEADDIQGVLIRWRRPARDGETLIGLPVANPVTTEVIEYHFTPHVEASREVCDITMGRAIQRALWYIDADQEAPDAR